MTGSQWADAHYYLSSESAGDPGKWRSQPQQVAILDAFTHPAVEYIDVFKSSRTGYTKILGAFIGYSMHQRPAPVLLVQPTDQDAKDYGKDEVEPMLRDVPVLHGLVRDGGGRRESGNTMTKKAYPGGILDIVGATSPGNFRRLTKKIALFDEVDGYPPGAGKEGDQIRLGTRRTQDFADRKIVVGSSPTVAGNSKIEKRAEASNMGYCMVPCPECDEFHVRKFSRNPRGIECGPHVLPVAHIEWPKGEPEKAAWACPSCGSLIGYEHHRDQLARCYWQGPNWTFRDGAFDFQESFNGKIGFFIWAGYTFSPNTTPVHIAREFLESKDDPELLKVFLNTIAGELWTERGEAPDLGEVEKLRRPYPAGSVPADVIGVTCGVDVQKTRLVYSVRGWCRGLTSYLVEAGELYGDTDQPEVWDQLQGLLDTEFDGWRIRLMLVDSGYRASWVYRFARANRGRVFASKGQERQNKPVRSAKIDVKMDGSASKTSLVLWHIDTDYCKTWLYGRFVWPAEQTLGGWFVHEDTEQEYLEQITSESLMVLPNGKRTWLTHGPNHWFDAEVLNYAASIIGQVHRLPDTRPAADGEEAPAPARRGRRVLSRPSAR